ncbi:VOC family protein [Capillimicrobium parvum]|uniref:Metallothiol transferase FosB n=1 Tax=Capillimicrobium parvum TaxID=2884022 RepID=A0A9E6Y0N7_9ACTN|nr:VOC family protein [Capillimicrobium parvum]UGS37266.1 Metallothiol transferase FosB [Capillimicrobium parvum]
MQVRVRNIGHIGITVRDLDRSVDFYTGVLGMRLTERFQYPADEVGHGVTVAAGAFVRCNATHHAISIFQLKDGLITDDAPDGSALGIGLHHIAFELATPGELLAKLREMREAGVQIVNCRKGGPGNQPRFYARDPDGHLLEFYWGIDEIGWDGIAREYEPIQEIDLDEFDFEAYLEQREEHAVRAQAIADDAGADLERA